MASLEDYGFTDAGFLSPSYDIILSYIQDELIKELGSLDFGDDNNDTVIGTITNVFAYLNNKSYQQIAYDVAQSNIDTAEGTALDNLVYNKFLTRLKASATKVLAQVTTNNYTVIPIGRAVEVQNTDYTFTNDSIIQVNQESCIGFVVNIDVNTYSQYKISIDANDYIYNVAGGETTADIALGLYNQLSADDDIYDLSLSGSKITINNIDYLTKFAVVVTEGISITSVKTNGIFTCTETGSIAVPVGSLNKIINQVAGWKSITNADAGLIGRAVETDTELRTRYYATDFIGKGTLGAVKSHVANLDGVIAVSGSQNRELVDTVDLPAKTFNIVVVGGDDTDIAQTIWDTQPAGTKSYGNTTIYVLDEDSELQPVSFSRATTLIIYCEVTISTTTEFQPEYISIIKDAIVAQINAVGLGGTVKYQSLYSSVYSVAGIDDATVKLSTDNIVYTESNIDASASEAPITDISKITIIQE